VFDPEHVQQDRLDRLRREWGVGPDDRIILHAARLTSWKGQHIVVEAARRLHQRGMLTGVVVLAGDAQGREGYSAGLNAAIRAGGLEERVRLVGHVSDMPAAYCLAAASVVASVEPEAFGRTAVESQAMGCPVIATRIGAPPETVLSPPEHGPHSMTGWLVPAGDAEALAGALLEALSLDTASRRELAARARSHAVSAFSLRQMRLKTLAVYDELIGTGLIARYVAERPQNND